MCNTVFKLTFKRELSNSLVLNHICLAHNELAWIFWNFTGNDFKQWKRFPSSFVTYALSCIQYMNIQQSIFMDLIPMLNVVNHKFKKLTAQPWNNCNSPVRLTCWPFLYIRSLLSCLAWAVLSTYLDWKPKYLQRVLDN